MKRSQTVRSGFSLLEILVALVLIGLLAGALVPSVLNQLSKGEVNRVVEDADGVANAAQLFRVDVNRWPSELDQLVTSLSGTPVDINGNTIPAGLRSRWAGPYLELGSIEGGTIPTSMGGEIQNELTTTTWNGTPFLTVTIADIGESDAESISQAVDGDTDITETDAGGRVRWNNDSGPALLYLAVPVNN